MIGNLTYRSENKYIYIYTQMFITLIKFVIFEFLSTKKRAR